MKMKSTNGFGFVFRFRQRASPSAGTIHERSPHRVRTRVVDIIAHRVVDGDGANIHKIRTYRYTHLSNPRFSPSSETGQSETCYKL